MKYFSFSAFSNRGISDVCAFLYLHQCRQWLHLNVKCSKYNLSVLLLQNEVAEAYKLWVHYTAQSFLRLLTGIYFFLGN